MKSLAQCAQMMMAAISHQHRLRQNEETMHAKIPPAAHTCYCFGVPGLAQKSGRIEPAETTVPLQAE